ncbi:MAG: tetratricopeptide repeat protein, partial [Clostridia bacterium]|nr:tetratricopeptide repeat protein [Clostridia bacterium]
MPKQNNGLTPTEFLAKKYFDRAEKLINGDGVPVDFKQAAEAYRQSAEGPCVPPHSQQAVEIFSAAADEGHPGGLNDLGFCYQRGLGVEQDHDKAFELFSRAADMDFAAAQNNVGDCYNFGRGVKADPEKAYMYYM